MIIYGKNVVKEAILNKRKIYELYLDNKFNDYKFISFLNENNIKFEKVDKGELNNLTNNGIHNGVVAKVKDYKVYDLLEVIDEGKRQRFLMLDEVQDPGNFGAILRSVEATKTDGVIVSKKHQVPITGVVAKASSGALEHVKIIVVGNINQTIHTLKDNNFLVVGTKDDAETSYKEIPKDRSVVVVMGNEGSGLRKLVMSNCDLLVNIPMYGKVNSLNVSVASALMLYEII